MRADLAGTTGASAASSAASIDIFSPETDASALPVAFPSSRPAARVPTPARAAAWPGVSPRRPPAGAAFIPFRASRRSHRVLRRRARHGLGGRGHRLDGEPGRLLRLRPRRERPGLLRRPAGAGQFRRRRPRAAGRPRLPRGRAGSTGADRPDAARRHLRRPGGRGRSPRRRPHRTRQVWRVWRVWQIWRVDPGGRAARQDAGPRKRRPVRRRHSRYRAGRPARPRAGSGRGSGPRPRARSGARRRHREFRRTDPAQVGRRDRQGRCGRGRCRRDSVGSGIGDAGGAIDIIAGGDGVPGGDGTPAGGGSPLPGVPAPVPLPAPALLLGGSLAGLDLLRRRSVRS